MADDNIDTMPANSADDPVPSVMTDRTDLRPNLSNAPLVRWWISVG